MKRQMICGACILSAALLLADPVTLQAAEITVAENVNIQNESIQEENAQSEVQDAQELLTAGAGDLFHSVLTESEYKEIAKKAEGALWGYTNLGICNVQENNLNVRQEPNESGKLVGKLPKNAACEVVGSEDGWAYIISGKVEGYVKEEYLLTGFGAKQKGEELASAVAVATTDALNIREEASTDSPIVTQVATGEILDIAQILDNGWIKVYLDDEEVYVSSDYVEVRSDLATAITMTELLYGQGVSDIRVDLCQYAKQFLGNPYVWGGTSLTSGADCSGFVLSVFAKFGVSLPHYSGSQSKCGTSISADQLQPGDLVFYAKGGTINHVAIYIGGGQVIHASSPKTGIKISAYNYRTPYKMVRILQD